MMMIIIHLIALAMLLQVIPFLRRFPLFTSGINDDAARSGAVATPTFPKAFTLRRLLEQQHVSSTEPQENSSSEIVFPPDGAGRAPGLSVGWQKHLQRGFMRLRGAVKHQTGFLGLYAPHCVLLYAELQADVITVRHCFLFYSSTLSSVQNG